MILGWAMVALTVTLTVLGQVIVKWQVSKAGVPGPSFYETVLWIVNTALSPWLLLVAILVVTAGGAWFVAMSRLPLSHSYPVLGISFPLVLIASVVLLGERVSLLHLTGTALIFAGVAMLGLAAR